MIRMVHHLTVLGMSLKIIALCTVLVVKISEGQLPR
jgi:hypothetical protein